jgi:hypothetical protein
MFKAGTPGPAWIFVLIFLWMAVALIPLTPGAPGIGLDASWARALNWSHAQNLIFGRDLIFTFGPLGYLLFPLPGVVGPGAAFACVWAVYAVFLSGVLLIWRALGNRLIVLVSWAVLGGAMLLIVLQADRMQIGFLSLAIGIVALAAARGYPGSVWLAIAGAIAGLLPLFKTNEGIAACAVFYAILAMCARSVPRKGVVLALVPPLTFILGFVLSEGNISALWPYVTGSLQIAMGYSEAMAKPGPMYLAVVGLFSLAALVVIPLAAASRRDLMIGLLPALMTGFFAFKSGVVRQDEMHADALPIKMAVAGVFLLVCAKSRREQWMLIAYAAAGLCFGAILYRQDLPAMAQIAERRALLQSPFANLSASVHMSSTWAWVDSQIRPELAKLRLDPEVSNRVSGGTVDDVPSELDIVEANGWRWKPRPVIQSYSAYTPALDQLNARHLGSPQSADHIILQWDDIDYRQPLLDDAASWRALFDNYDVELTRPEFLVLKRRESPRYLDPQPIGSVTGAWQSDIAIPESNGLVIMRAEIDKSLYGSLRGLLFRNAGTYVTATSVSGTQSHWRVTRENLVDGAFITWLPQDVREAMPYFGQQANALPERISTIRFETAGPAEFSSEIRISWYSVGFRSGGGSIPQTSKVETVPEAGALAHHLAAETKGFIDAVNGQPLSGGSVEASSRGPVTLSGWVIDEPAHKVASAVYIDVDGNLFPASYGLSRPDVADALKEPGCEKSGFKGQFHAGPGSHQVRLRVVNAAGNGYYYGPSFALRVN